MDVAQLTSLAREAPLNARGPAVAHFDEYTVGLSKFDAHPKWEIHPGGDELLQVLSGRLEVTVLKDDGTTSTVTLQEGSVFVVPRNTWHSPVPRGEVAILHVANYEGTELSNDEDPRQ